VPLSERFREHASQTSKTATPVKASGMSCAACHASGVSTERKATIATTEEARVGSTTLLYTRKITAVIADAWSATAIHSWARGGRKERDRKKKP
jgi:hypothetical protein